MKQQVAPVADSKHARIKEKGIPNNAPANKFLIKKKKIYYKWGVLGNNVIKVIFKLKFSKMCENIRMWKFFRVILNLLKN